MDTKSKTTNPNEAKRLMSGSKLNALNGMMHYAERVKTLNAKLAYCREKERPKLQADVDRAMERLVEAADKFFFSE